MRSSASIVIGIVIGTAIFSFVSYYLGRAIFQPLVSARPAKARRTQFLITDIYVLIAQLMAMGALLAGDGIDSDHPEKLVSMLLSWLLLGWWWWMGVGHLSRAEIMGSWPRAVILGAAVPFAFGNFLLLFMLIPVTQRMPILDTHSFLLLLFTALFLLILFMLFSGCKKLLSWAIASARKDS